MSWICCSTQQTVKNSLLNYCKCKIYQIYTFDLFKTLLRMNLESSIKQKLYCFFFKAIKWKLGKFNFTSQFNHDYALFDQIELIKYNNKPFELWNNKFRSDSKIVWNYSANDYIVEIQDLEDLTILMIG
ncbi:unnamed protein product [Paramecium octaurelia]|uniref:Uncharacterized protein n=1 Tax=Paramecium octaurelia TaxID=43137 RepID=A0A8S1Y567_PAROT|nr:unnamed protein product [Paramecium octaurelia]